MQPGERLRQLFTVARRSPEPSSPCERALDDPPPRRQHEALSRFRELDDFEPHVGRGGGRFRRAIGNNFLSDFDVEINVPASSLRLYPHRQGGNASTLKLDERASVPNEAADKGFIVLKVLIEGKPVTAILDTGAPTSVLNWAAAKQVGVTTTTKGLKRRGRGTGGLGSQVADTYLYRFDRVEAGRTRFDAGEVRIADLAVFKTLGLGDKPAMLFGVDMLRDRALFVSYSTKKLYFYKPAS